jgi:hypothetical protein
MQRNVSFTGNQNELHLFFSSHINMVGDKFGVLIFRLYFFVPFFLCNSAWQSCQMVFIYITTLGRVAKGFLFI